MNAQTTAPVPFAGRWAALGVIAVAQLLTALDATIVNIALPTAQQDLGFGDGQRQWVITAYTLTFAGLLLIGGRIADRVGRRTALLGVSAGSPSRLPSPGSHRRSRSSWPAARCRAPSPPSSRRRPSRRSR